MASTVRHFHLRSPHSPSLQKSPSLSASPEVGTSREELLLPTSSMLPSLSPFPGVTTGREEHEEERSDSRSAVALPGVNGWCNENIPNVAHSQDDRSFQFTKSSEAYNFNGHNLIQHMLGIENAVRTLIIIGIVICVLLLVVLVCMPL
ncbi:hypothetical protein RHSIM_Rhsim03G0202200 [Rhododendron simsii]|uniref:Uncharacterized protein n=1 Tax=Rhododendron simsii TaxID=118357 RepID=A0A834HB78_RHOSS|nr:hypothetical protein RHSIM_Rhsim03G0202200 [Rhododendron simsii]